MSNPAARLYALYERILKDPKNTQMHAYWQLTLRIDGMSAHQTHAAVADGLRLIAEEIDRLEELLRDRALLIEYTTVYIAALRSTIDPSKLQAPKSDNISRINADTLNMLGTLAAFLGQVDSEVSSDDIEALHKVAAEILAAAKRPDLGEDVKAFLMKQARVVKTAAWQCVVAGPSAFAVAEEQMWAGMAGFATRARDENPEEVADPPLPVDIYELLTKVFRHLNGISPSPMVWKKGQWLSGSLLALDPPDPWPLPPFPDDEVQ